MRLFPVAVAFIPLLSACSMAQPPQSEAEVVAEMAKVAPPKPGRWSAHFELMAFAADGAPAEVADRIRRELAARGRLGQVMCLTPEMIEEAFKGKLTTYDGASCRVADFRTGEAGYTATLVCNYANEMNGTVKLSGDFGAELSRETAQVELALIREPDKRITYMLESRSELVGSCAGK